jgi:hypothetical protein
MILFGNACSKTSPTHALRSSDVALRRLITDLQTGKPNYDSMSPAFAQATKQQLPRLQAMLAALGPVRSTEFLFTGDQGSDVYVVRYEHGDSDWSITMGPNGIITKASVMAAPPGAR